MQQKMVYCNKCGRAICLEDPVEKVDYLKIHKDWGYFSNKDGIGQDINICEDCYDDMVKGFQIPPTEVKNTELL